MGVTLDRSLWASAEGAPEWVDVGTLHELPLVDDLYELLPRALAGPFFFVHYAPDAAGEMQYLFA